MAMVPSMTARCSVPVLDRLSHRKARCLLESTSKPVTYSNAIDD